MSIQNEPCLISSTNIYKQQNVMKTNDYIKKDFTPNINLQHSQTAQYQKSSFYILWVENNVTFKWSFNKVANKVN